MGYGVTPGGDIIEVNAADLRRNQRDKKAKGVINGTETKETGMMLNRYEFDCGK